MPTITDPVAVRFSNQALRTIADELAGVYAACKERLLSSQQTAASGGTIASVFAAAPADLIDDGSLVGGAHSTTPDGRGNVAGGDAAALLAVCQQVVSLFEANQSALLLQVAKFKVNTLTF